MAELLEYKCPSCGGAINFDSASQQMVCPYCDTSFEIADIQAYNEELAKEQPSNISWDMDTTDDWGGEDAKIGIYSCKSCGGEIIGDETTAAMSCPYCDNPVVMSGQLSGVLKPDLIIPFKLDKKLAKEAYAKHLMGKKLLPKVFRDQNHIDEIKGVYVPFWLFDADADVSIRYKGQQVNSWSDSKYRYTETKHFSVLREGSIAYDNVPVDGSQKMDDTLMESLEPYNMADAVDFRTAYLAGYLADKYDVDADASIGRVNDRMATSAEDEFRGTVVGFSNLIVEHSSINVKNGRAWYALLPVWLLNTTWKDQKFVFAMNGQTGKFVGDLPTDKGLFWKWFGIVGAAATAVAFGVQLLISML